MTLYFKIVFFEYIYTIPAKSAEEFMDISWGQSSWVLAFDQ